MIEGTISINDAYRPGEIVQASTGPAANGDQEQAKFGDDEQTLESHEVIELQTFIERKEWIEDKIKYLEKLPPVEVFIGLDAVRASAEEVPGLPTRAQLKELLAEHNRIEKETEIFDSGELKKLKSFALAALKRHLTTEDTNLIELTLHTITALDKLLHLLRDRADSLDLLKIRLTWEERRTAAWKDLRQLLSDIKQFLTTRARWSPNAYDAILPEDEPPKEPIMRRRNSVVSITSTMSDSASQLAPCYSRSNRFKLAETLTREAAHFGSRVSNLKHTKIASAGKTLDKLIDRSRNPVPDELLDEQDKLEDKGISELEDVGKFILSVVSQWKKADETYVETLTDKAAAQALLDELEVAELRHPTSRHDMAFQSRANALCKRLKIRGNPAAPGSTFPRPSHPLYPDQAASDEAIVRLLSCELASAADLAQRAQSRAQGHHARYEAVKRVETVCKTASELSGQFEALLERLEKGVGSEDGDGSSIELNSEACLEDRRHAAFLAALPTIMLELQKVDAEATALLPNARVALLHLDRPGVDSQFKLKSIATVEHLVAVQKAAIQKREAVSTNASALVAARQLWTAMGRASSDVEEIRSEVVDATTRQQWRQQVRSHDAPPTPESPTALLPPLAISPASILAKLNDLQARLQQDIHLPLSVLAPATGPALRGHLTQYSTRLDTNLANVRKLASLWEAVQNQACAMECVRDDVHGLQCQMEDLKVRYDRVIQEVLTGDLFGDELLFTEGGLDSDLKRLQVSSQSLLDELPYRVPFIAQTRTSNGPRVGHASKPSLPSNVFGRDLLQESLSLDLPVDPATLDHVVRADSNAYSMMLSGAIEVLEQKAKHLQLAKIAQAVDVAVASVLDNVRRLAKKVASIQNSFATADTVPATELSIHLDNLSQDVERLLQIDALDIARSLSPVRGLLHRLQRMSDGHELGIQDGMVGPRQRALDDVEDQLNTLKESAAGLQQQIARMQQTEREKRVEELRLKEERERIEAEERDRALREQAEAERVERERVEAEERALQEERERVDRERLDAEKERQRLEEATRFLDHETAGSIYGDQEERPSEDDEEVEFDAEQTILAIPKLDVLEPLEESDLEDEDDDDDDIFGLGSPVPQQPQLLQSLPSDLQFRISSLRKRLRSIHINEMALPGTRLDLPLPSDNQRKRMEQEVSAVAVEAMDLPISMPNDVAVDAELRSLRNEIEVSNELMVAVHKLADLSIALKLCDDAFSDLLEHIDSYPVTPWSILLTTHVSDFEATPEDQMAARLDFTRSAIEDMSSRFAAVNNDSRAIAEHERIMQTWSELEAMGRDSMDDTKSRPASVLSSGRSSRASTTSQRSAAVMKKAKSYAKLSAGSSQDGRYLTPLQANGRRPAAARSQSRSSSRASMVSANRSVSGPSVTPTASSRLYAPTFASRQRTVSVSSAATPTKASVKQYLQDQETPRACRPRASVGQMSRSHTPLPPRTASPAMSETSSRSISRAGMSHSSTRSSWSRAPRQSFSSALGSPPLTDNEPMRKERKPYVANPKNKLDVALGDVINNLAVDISVEPVTDTWQDQSGKYWIGDQDPKLCFCRILRSQTVMVRVGGGWTELSRFIKEHFADAFRILPESPPGRLGSREEKWISSASLSQAATSMSPPLPPSETPEPKSPFIPSFSLTAPSGASPKSIHSSTPGSPRLTAMQFLRQKGRESPAAMRPETPMKSIRSMHAARQPAWRP
ncbi:hypothetical protein WOLCODRAFT_71007 [Wolfiporia cocos MD-104 SS10]|uniref:GAR domain-containing protein n=1 Tax=Wolfiporia cocos (strain MD-104) TaxID=742152 RepID=A0A2H3JJ98_WOLCO|nr:hypothetical protein WOLCODRAFT_71007 [Wolfiporia cocos MD-104 SS10]